MRLSKLGRFAVPLLSATVLAQLVACGAKHGSSDDGMTSPNSKEEVKITPSLTMVSHEQNANKELVSNDVAMTVLGGKELIKLQAAGKITKNVALLDSITKDIKNVKTPGEGAAVVDAESMYVAYPIKLLGEGHLFGGVITAVDDKDNDTLGGLKLTDLPAINNRAFVNKDANGNYSVVLVGCFSKCSELSEQTPFLSFPVVGVSDDKESLVLDLSKFGTDFNLLEVVGVEGEYSGLKTISTKTQGIDYSTSTLVWDVVNTMIPNDKDPADATAPKTHITSRFYMKLEAGLNSAFVARKATDGVGFFSTQWAKDALITRFSATSFDGNAPVHYYFKNVPAEEQDNFKQAITTWNVIFNGIVDHDLLSYEFVKSGTPEGDAIVAGDARYNVVEWDLNNNATYGGLGPSIASQTTGQTFSANILVQGPAIHKIYKQWYGVADQVKALQADGKSAEADALFLATRREMLAKLAHNDAAKTARPVLGMLNFRDHVNSAALKDPVASRQDFFALPDGESYNSFMKGYWLNLVGHEMGHNLGLRHNFRGNLHATEDASGTSSSIMEYLNREFRNRNPQGFYDVMAMKYGYTGVAPTRTDLFCTDEDVFDADHLTNSAECSRDDATTDSFAYFSKVSQHALDLLVNRGSFAAPTWVVSDVTNEFGYSLRGRLAYAASADATSKTWVNWAKNGRPTEPAEIKAFVLKTLQAELCAPAIRKAADQKNTQEGKDAVVKNLVDLDNLVIAETTKLKLDATALKCN